MSDQKHYYRTVLFWVITLFLLFAGCFVLFQNQREKRHHAELLHTRLQDFNHDVYVILDLLKSDTLSGGWEHRLPLQTLVERQSRFELRLTLIDTLGHVVYDSSITGDSLSSPQTHLYADVDNHLDRTEIREAMETGEGVAVIRHSATMSMPYFYAASYREGDPLIVRSAIPYNTEMHRELDSQSDNYYLWIAGLISIILIILFVHTARKMGSSINEKENLLAHLRISNEGLGVFSPQRKLILANTLFNRYVNLISDHHLSSAEKLLTIDEMAPMREFLDHSDVDRKGDEEPGISFIIEKGGRLFSVQGVVFSDKGFEISINDITRREEQSRLKRQLTQNISHELKTPVSSISGYLETIIEAEKQGSLTPEQRMHFLQRCFSQCERLNNLVQDIATLDRMNNASSKVEKVPVDVSLLLRNLIQEENLQLEQQQMQVDNRLPQSLVLQGDASMLYSIFRNLLDNTISYAGTGATITVRMFRVEGRTFYFSYADDGAGIDEEHLPRIFERFYRVDKGRSRKLGGTGLGLAIVKNAVSLHGGNITAKQRPGGGLEFIFTIEG